MVRSILLYCSQLWSPYNRKKEMIMLEQVQRQATRYIVNYIDISYVDRLLMCNLLPLCFVREIFDISLFFNLIHNRLDVDLDRYFIMRIHPPRTRRDDENRTNMIHRILRTESAISFYTNRILYIWNSLPDIIRLINPPPRLSQKPFAFKKMLTDFYKEQTVQIFDVHNQCTWTIKCRCSNCRPL